VQTLKRIGNVSIASGDGDPFDEIPFVNALVNLDANIGGYKLYDSGALAAPQPSIDVAGISQDYSSLRLLLRARSDVANAAGNPRLRFNNDAGNNYRYVASAAGGGLHAADSGIDFAAIGDFTALNSLAGYFALVAVEIPFYSEAREHDLTASLGSQYDNLGNAVLAPYFAHWAQAAAINRVAFACATGNLIAGSRLVIYGVA
jgi:hypothetical protein